MARLNGAPAVGRSVAFVGWELNFLTEGHFRARAVKINNLFNREQNSRLGAEGNESKKVSCGAGQLEPEEFGVLAFASGKSYDCVINDVIKEMFANGKQGIVLSFCIFVLATWPQG